MNKKGLIAKALSFLPRSKRLEGILLVMATLVTSILEALGISLILPILTLTLDGNLDQLHFNFEIFFDKITVFGDSNWDAPLVMRTKHVNIVSKTCIIQCDCHCDK